MSSVTTPEATTTETAGGADAAIRKVVNDYYVGLRDADLKSLGAAFKDFAVVCGYIDTTLYEKHVKTLYDFVLEEGAAGEKFTCKIDALTIAGDTAVVTLNEHDYLGVDYTTSLHLISDTDGWGIASKLFNGTTIT